jgi:hypothetical protein
MKGKTLLLGLLPLLILLAISCGQSPQTTPTNTQPPTTTTQTKTQELFVAGECPPSTDGIEMNKRLTKGFGAGYTALDASCAVYCLWVPDGSQLIIGIADLDAKLYLHVTDDLYTRWDSGLPENEGNKTKYLNPSGRYYIYVCPDEDPAKFMSHERKGGSITFTDATLFTLYNEFTP